MTGVFVCVCLQVAKAVSQALNRSVNCLPGQRDVDNAIRTVGEASKKLLSNKVSPLAIKTFHKLQSIFQNAVCNIVVIWMVL